MRSFDYENSRKTTMMISDDGNVKIAELNSNRRMLLFIILEKRISMI